MTKLGMVKPIKERRIFGLSHAPSHGGGDPAYPDFGDPYYCPHGLTQNNQIWYDTTWESGMRIFGVSHAPM